MKIDEMKNKRVELVKEARSILDTAKAESRNLSDEERSRYDAVIKEADGFAAMVEAEERVARLEKSIADVPQDESRENKEAFSEIRSAMTEKRAITVNGTGAVNVVSQIVKQMSQKKALIGKYRYFYGPNASTVIPILSPGLATPAGQSEGATGLSSDSTAVLGASTILPKAYVSILPVSAEAMLLSGASIEAELPSIFADAFGTALFNGSLTGAGTGNTMTGMFVDAALTNNVSCAASGAPKLIDLFNLAASVKDYADDAVIVIHHSFITSMMNETTSESTPIKNELLIKGTVYGVPVVTSGAAPSATTEGSVVAVAMPMSNYAVGMADELQIDPIKVKGDTNTYFQATSFFNGKPIVAKNGWQLVAIAAG